MDERTAIAKYLNETWTDDEHAEIESYGRERAAELYGQNVLPEQEEPELPDEADLTDMVFGPSTPSATMHYTAMQEGGDRIGHESDVLQEHAEWQYLAQFFDDAEVYGSWKFHLHTGDTTIQLVSSACTDGEAAVEGEKAVRISPGELDEDALQEMDSDMYDLHIGIDAPDSVTVEGDVLGSDDINERVVQKAREQVDTSDDYRITSEFEGGRLDTGDTLHPVILEEYTPDEQAEKILDLVGL